MFTRDFIKSLLEKNSIIHDFKKPLVVVYRNTNRNGEEVYDNGTNICDIVMLMDPVNFHILQGRTYPHDKYQDRMVRGVSKANFIASGYYEKAWQKGTHRGYRALRQNSKFIIWRSKDMELGDGDDWNEKGLVFDNLHASAPYSAGCVTVRGNGKNPSGDWKIADNWIYNQNKNNHYFSLVIFQHEDLDGKPRLRIGSKGERVKALQKVLQESGQEIVVDGDFGWNSHIAVRRYQNARGFKSDGIIEFPPPAAQTSPSAPAPTPPVTPAPTPATPAPAAPDQTSVERIFAALKAKSQEELIGLGESAGIKLEAGREKRGILTDIKSALEMALAELDT